MMDVYRKSGLLNGESVIFAHSIAPAFICKYLIKHKLHVKRLVFVCGFNDYFGINEEYDAVNGSMFVKHIERIKNFCKDIVCLYSDNDPYVAMSAEKDFADKVSTRQIVVKGGGHLNSESGRGEFKELVEFL